MSRNSINKALRMLRMIAYRASSAWIIPFVSLFLCVIAAIQFLRIKKNQKKIRKWFIHNINY
ncbi:TPA: hypothetical protein ACIVWC_003412, partial [Salmonella enterica subsp. diarizonae serovar 61:l,v:z35]